MRLSNAPTAEKLLAVNMQFKYSVVAKLDLAGVFVSLLNSVFYCLNAVSHHWVFYSLEFKRK